MPVPNLARYCVLDPSAESYYPGWEEAADTTGAGVAGGWTDTQDATSVDHVFAKRAHELTAGSADLPDLRRRAGSASRRQPPIAAATCESTTGMPTTLCNRRWAGARAHRVQRALAMPHVIANQSACFRLCSGRAPDQRDVPQRGYLCLSGFPSNRGDSVIRILFLLPVLP